MVEQEAVNFEVTGSSPVRGAKNIKYSPKDYFFIFFCFSGLDENLQVRPDDEANKNLELVLDSLSEEERKDFVSTKS